MLGFISAPALKKKIKNQFLISYRSFFWIEGSNFYWKSVLYGTLNYFESKTFPNPRDVQEKNKANLHNLSPKNYWQISRPCIFL